QSFVDPVLTALAVAGEEGDFSQLQIIDAAGFDDIWWQPGLPALLYQVDDQDAASRVKLALMEVYPDDYRTRVVHHAGIAGEERVASVPLFELDRQAASPYDHLSSIYLPPLQLEKRRADFQQFVEII